MTTITRRQSRQEPGWLLIDVPDSIVESEAGDMPQWLLQLRRDALEKFRGRGLPASRDEHWRQMNLRPIREAMFQLAPDMAGEVSAKDVERAGMEFPGSGAVRLVFVNGQYVAELSDERSLPKGVSVTTIREAMADAAPLLKAHLAQHADDEHDPFVTLNTALLDDGLFLHVAKNVSVDAPIYLLCITIAPQDSHTPILTHPRNLIVTEEGARATIIEDYVGLRQSDQYLTNAVTELVVGENAEVHHYLLERDSARAFNISTLTAVQYNNSKLSSHSVLLGGSIVRNNVNPVLDGEGCHSLLNGLYIGADGQILDNNMRVEHNKAHCDSRQYYKGILNDEAHGIFTGRIIVARDAQKTDAVQSNQNLLLSRNARANTKPQLEIYADDVKCTHGATVGEMDEEAVFYLRSRGLSADGARSLLVRAFAGESLGRMDVEALREQLERLIAARLPFSGRENV